MITIKHRTIVSPHPGSGASSCSNVEGISPAISPRALIELCRWAAGCAENSLHKSRKRKCLTIEEEKKAYDSIPAIPSPKRCWQRNVGWKTTTTTSLSRARENSTARSIWQNAKSLPKHTKETHINERLWDVCTNGNGRHLHITHWILMNTPQVGWKSEGDTLQKGFAIASVSLVLDLPKAGNNFAFY